MVGARLPDVHVNLTAEHDSELHHLAVVVAGRLPLLEQREAGADYRVGAVDGVFEPCWSLDLEDALFANGHHLTNRLNSGISGPKDGSKQTVNAALTTSSGTWSQHAK